MLPLEQCMTYVAYSAYQPLTTIAVSYRPYEWWSNITRRITWYNAISSHQIETMNVAIVGHKIYRLDATSSSTNLYHRTIATSFPNSTADSSFYGFLELFLTAFISAGRQLHVFSTWEILIVTTSRVEKHVHDAIVVLNFACT